MKLDDISKVLNESKAKRCEETESLRKLSDVDFCGKMISFLEENLDENQKEVSHGDGVTFYSYYEIEESFEDVFDVGAALLYFKALFYYEILGFCACGSPQMILNGVILPLLEAYCDGPYENFDRNYGKNTGLSEAMVEFFLHYLDERGLTNHGSSVWGSWLEESGRLWREVLRRTEEIEV